MIRIPGASSTNKTAQTMNSVVALVTGGSSGLGAATASALVRQGAKVLVADLPSTKESFDEWATKLEDVPVLSAAGYDTSRGPALSFHGTDVTDETQIRQSLDAVEDRFGVSINCAVNCAGVAVARKTLSKKGPHSLQEFSNTLQVNTIGTFNVARLAAERMSRHETDGDGLRGCIVNTASIAAYEGQIGQVAYATSKAAIVGMTLPMARDLASLGIRVMTIAPGLFATPLLDGLPEDVKQELGATVPCPSRLGNPDEFGQLVCTILGNPMLNGSVIRLDGALRMPP